MRNSNQSSGFTSEGKIGQTSHLTAGKHSWTLHSFTNLFFDISKPSTVQKVELCCSCTKTNRPTVTEAETYLLCRRNSRYVTEASCSSVHTCAVTEQRSTCATSKSCSSKKRPGSVCLVACGPQGHKYESCCSSTVTLFITTCSPPNPLMLQISQS